MGCSVIGAVVIAAHGAEWIDQCRESLAGAQEPILVIDTGGSNPVPGADVRLEGGYSTGAYRWAVQNCRGVDEWLFLQDSMTCVVPDPMPWFRDQLPTTGDGFLKRGAVAWQRFPMQWDNDEQRREVEARYPGVYASHGIFGPVFYTTRDSMDALLLAGAGRGSEYQPTSGGIMPKVPTSRIEAQGAERAWAFAFAAVGYPVAGPEWQPHDLVAGNVVGPFRKVFAARP